MDRRARDVQVRKNLSARLAGVRNLLPGSGVVSGPTCIRLYEGEYVPWNAQGAAGALTNLIMNPTFEAGDRRYWFKYGEQVQPQADVPKDVFRDDARPGEPGRRRLRRRC